MYRILLALSAFLFLTCESREQAPAAKEPTAAAGAAASLPAALSIDTIYRQLFDAHERYREPAIQSRRFKHADIEPLVSALQAPFAVREAGQSIEGRPIYLVQLGDGPRPVLLWSQMHGDEPTATMALMDLFNFFGQSDEFDALRQRLLNELTLYFIPMLNPDGAELFQRRNALDIDLNRDALRLQCPESQILKQVRDETQAQWGFNLHDQNRYYAAGNEARTASISFLAPAFNYDKDINEVRGNAMRLIVLLDQVLQEYIPGKVGRYDDTFEPRAFGDNIQKWGTSTILIESGGLEDDPEKQFLRQLNFTILLAAFNGIANAEYAAAPLRDYERIPFNNSNAYHDLIIREAQVEKEGKWYTVDLGFRHNEIAYDNHSQYFPRASIADIGDLSTFYAYEELDARAYRIIPGRTHPSVFASLDALRQADVAGMLRQGYSIFQLEKQPRRSEWARLPLEVTAAGKVPANDIRLNGNPSFFLQKEGQLHYAIINGFVYNLKAGGKQINALLK